MPNQLEPVELILLAGGYGVRMGNLGSGRPKILVPIIQNLSIVEVTLTEALSVPDIKRVILIVSDVDFQTKPYLQERGFDPDRVVVINRLQDAFLGPIGTIVRGLEFAKASRLLIGNGDTVFHRKIIEACVRRFSQHGEVFLCASLELSRQPADDVILEIEGGRKNRKKSI